MNEPFQTNARDFEPNAAWITCPEQKEPLLGGMPATYFRKTFSVNDTRLPAEITIAALGLFALFINEKNQIRMCLPRLLPTTIKRFSITYIISAISYTAAKTKSKLSSATVGAIKTRPKRGVLPSVMENDKQNDLYHTRG